MRERLAELLGQVRRLAGDLPRPTPVQWLKAAPFAIFALAMLVLLVRNHDIVDFPNYDAPDDFVPAPPPTTQPPGFQQPLLASVAGATTTTVPANVGTARLTGTVRGPQGFVSGAVVRIERSILGEVQRLDVLTDATGAWDAPNIGGGRYRVRAFLAPTLAQRTAEVFLLPAGENRQLDLVTEAFGEPSIELAAAPVPAHLDQPVNVAVQVSARTVDSDGIVTAQGLSGLFVEVTHSQGWDRDTAAGSLVTDAGGRVVVTYTCRQVGVVTIQAIARVGVAPPAPAPPPDPAAPPTATTAPGAVPATTVTTSASFDCIDPATLTTTTTTTVDSTVDGPGNSTTTTTVTTAPTETTTTTEPDE